jgi:REP element-mobilizing transposase RayT
VFHVVTRLADSLPVKTVQRIKDEQRRLAGLAAKDGKLNKAEIFRLRRWADEKMAALLDSGLGSCLLKEPRYAQIVLNAVMHFHGSRYTVHACCVMPNHVHIMVQPISPYTLSKIIHSWNSFTGQEILAQAKQPAPLWQREPYDHIIRSEASYMKCLEYVTTNASRAGLVNWPWVWRLGVCDEG